MAKGRRTLSTDNTSTVPHGIGCVVLLLVCALVPHNAFAQAPPPGVFAEVQAAVVQRPSTALEPATMRSRVVQVDTQKITAARRGREVLKLNLFDDEVVEVQIKRVRPTRSGYFISGTPRSMEWGEVRLVVNGSVMVGTVETPKGKFTIRSGGSGQHIIRQIDRSKESFECEVEDTGQNDPSSLPAISSIGSPPSGRISLPTVQFDDVPTEDGSEIRVLMLYTAAMQAEQGGPAGMRAFVDLLIESTNQAFEEGGINPRLVLAHAALVDYVAQVPEVDKFYLTGRFDGQMDEIHALRNEYAADLVHLITNSTRGRSGQLGNAGVAGRITAESLSGESSAAFAVTASGRELTFAHEIGHNFGLRHDRFVNSSGPNTIYPYAFGYVNSRAFEPDAPESSQWRTIMAYVDRCSAAGFWCGSLFRFSNPDQTYMGDALGVSADSMAEGADGPADARLAINKSARWVGSFRSEACTDFSVASETYFAPIDGGEVIIRVETTPGCIWEAGSEADFLQITSGRYYASNDLVTIHVEPNRSGSERIGTISAAGKNVELRQFAISQGVCGRTSVVIGALTQAAGLSSAEQCAEISEEDLSGIASLDLSQQAIGTLKPGDFDGMTDLQRLNLSDNRLTALPVGLFNGLSSLEELDLQDNQLTELQEPLFSGLSNLKKLYLNHNQLTVLPEGLLSGLANLEQVTFNTNRLTAVPEGLFRGLSNLQSLSIGGGNRLMELPAGLFADLANLRDLGLDGNLFFEVPQGLFTDLTNLESLGMDNTNLARLPPGLFANLAKINYLNLRRNDLSSLPDGIFSGLSQLRQLYLDRNRVNFLLMSVSLEKVSDGHVKAIAPVGAPFDIVVPIIVESGGEVEGGATSFTIPIGAVESKPLQIARVTGSQKAVSVELGELPGIPAKGHLGYALTKEGSLSRRVLPSIDPSDAALIELTVTNAPLDPAFSPDKSNYRAVVENERPSVTLLTKTSNPHATVAILAESDEPLVDTDVTKAGHQMDVLVGENAIKVEVSSEDGTKQIYTLVVTRDNALNSCARTKQVWKAVLAEVQDISECKDITEAHLSQIRELDLFEKDISSLKSIDFIGMTALERIDLRQNQLTGLPRDVFSGLADLRRLTLSGNLLTSLPAEIFSGPSKLEVLSLRGNRLTTLPPDVFAGLAALKDLWLHGNELDSLPEDIFAGLPELLDLYLSQNEFRSLPPRLFARLPKLQQLGLEANLLEELPSDVFKELTQLRRLDLDRNRLRGLPVGIFSGLSELERLDLRFNSITPLPLSVSVEKVGDGQFKAIMPTGAPFAVVVPISATSNGTLDNDADEVTIPIGSVESEVVGVQRIADSEAAVAVDIGTLPSLPDLHRGYFLQRDRALPLEVIPVPKAPPPAQVSGVVVVAGAERLLLSWDVVLNAGGYKVQWKSGEEEYDDARQALVAGGESVSYTIAGLSASREYTIRVIATNENADDGPPSSEVTGTPSPLPASQVTGVEVAQGVELLDVSWDALSDANGYKVQWKSGDEEYDESRQAVVSGGETVNYTITGLTAGTEYTIRVIATQENTDDGTPSSEVAGIPKAFPPSQVTGVEVTVGVGQLALIWTANADANGYKVQWTSDEQDYDDSRQATITDGDDVDYTITGLTAGTEHTVRIIATKVNAEDSLPSDEVTGTPRAMPAGQVTGVQVSSGVEQLDVSWTAVSDTSGYRVQWKSGDEAYGAAREVEVAGGETLGHTITGLTAGTEYTVRVIAVMDNADDGPPSSEVSGAPKALPPAQVTDVELSVGVEQLGVSWSVVSDASGYKVQWKSGEEDYDEARQTVVTGGNTVNYTIAGLTVGTSYTIRVIATKAHADGGAPSTEVTGIPKAGPPVQVEGVEVTPGVEQLGVSWTSASDAGGYKVQWKSGSEDYAELRQAVLIDGDTVSHTIESLTAGTEYTVRVIATKEFADDGLPSEQVTAIPKATPPAQVTGVEVEPGAEQLEVSWTPVTDAGGYKVQWKLGTEAYGDARQAVIGSGDTTTHTITDLIADTEYTIRVIATKDNADDGLPSDEVTATPISADPDVNGDGVLDGNDALIMYHSYASAAQLGDGETGGTPESRQSLLAGYSGQTSPSDDDLKAMIRKANAWKKAGADAGGDINEDGAVDESDAFVMYYAYATANLVGDGEAGGTARFRQLLLAAFANKANPTDEDLKAMLRRANKLREEFG